MSVKTAGVGHFQIPTAPAAGTSCTSGAANAYTTNAVQLIASTAAALYVTGVHAEAAAASAATYKSVQLMIGAGGAETVLGQYLVPMHTGSTVALGFHPIFPPIPVASGQRIAVKTADSVGAQATLISLECIAQSNVVDDGITVGTVNLVNTATTLTNLPAITANWLTAAGIAASALNGKGDWNIGKTGYALSAAGVQAVWDALTSALTTVGSIGKLIVTNLDALISSRMATYTQPTGFLAATFPAGTVANTTNITAGTMTTTTNLTTNNDKTGYSLSAAAVQAIWDALTSALTTVGSIGKLIVTNLDAAITSRLATAGYTAPDNTSVAAIKVQTDKLVFTVANKLDVNVLVINGITLIGDGTTTPMHG